MKNFIYGIVTGIVISFLFIMIGGGKLIQKMGKKSEEFRNSVIEKFEKGSEKAKEKIEEIAK